MFLTDVASATQVVWMANETNKTLIMSDMWLITVPSVYAGV